MLNQTSADRSLQPADSLPPALVNKVSWGHSRFVFHLHTACGCIGTTTAELQSGRGVCGAWKIFTASLFTQKDGQSLC